MTRHVFALFALLSLSYRFAARASMRAKQRTGHTVRMWLTDRVLHPGGGVPLSAALSARAVITRYGLPLGSSRMSLAHDATRLPSVLALKTVVNCVGLKEKPVPLAMEPLLAVAVVGPVPALTVGWRFEFG